jgi:hypothetical protein
MNATQSNPRYDETQAAKFLGLRSRQTLSNWRYRRCGPVYHRVGSRIVYLESDLQEYMDTGRVNPEEGSRFKRNGLRERGAV